MNNQLQHLLESATTIDTGILQQIENCLVIAPHPDDESLGCGGLISSLRQSGITVDVVFTTDGTMSHPNSQHTDTSGRCVLREKEAINALEVLGVANQNVTFLRGKDSALPAEGEEGFHGFVNQLATLIARIRPGLVLVPYEFDPHRDHRASWQITMKALAAYPEVEVWQYLIWLYTLGKDQDVAPLTNIPGGIQYLPVNQHRELKKKAIAQHQSQLDLQVFGDPDGFILKDEVLQNFYGEKEFYIRQ